MFDKFFDRAKGFAILMVVAAFLGIAGMLSLTGAAAWYLTEWMTWPAALGVTGGSLMAIAVIGLWIGTLPRAKHKDPEPQPSHDDQDPIAMVLAMMDLPVEVTKRIVAEKPLASIIVVASVGLLIARNPNSALKLFDKVVKQFTGTNP